MSFGNEGELSKSNIMHESNENDSKGKGSRSEQALSCKMDAAVSACVPVASASLDSLPSEPPSL
jgi:hypothetical protein